MADSSAQALAPSGPFVAGNTAAQIEYWKHGVNVTMHFTDMCIRLRILCLTVLATFFAGAAVSIAQYPDGVIRAGSIEMHISAALYLIAFVFVCSLWLLDQCYYYRMLLASVDNSEHVEPKVQAVIYNLVEGDMLTKRLTGAIPRIASAWIANVFYGVQASIALGLIVWACVAPNELIATRAAPTRNAHIERAWLGPLSASAESIDLRGREAQ